MTNLAGRNSNQIAEHARIKGVATATTPQLCDFIAPKITITLEDAYEIVKNAASGPGYLTIHLTMILVNYLSSYRTLSELVWTQTWPSQNLQATFMPRYFGATRSSLSQWPQAA